MYVTAVLLHFFYRFNLLLIYLKVFSIGSTNNGKLNLEMKFFYISFFEKLFLYLLASLWFCCMHLVYHWLTFAFVQMYGSKRM